jgi:hypothetical protein
MQLPDAALAAEQAADQLQFFLQVLDILGRSAMVAGDDLVAAAVVAEAVAERQVNVDRQGQAGGADVALGEPLPELRLAERLDEPVGGRIGGIARAARVVLADQHRVDHQFGGRVVHLEPL